MIEAYFSEIEKRILANLQPAKQEIKVAVAWMTNPRLFNVLLSHIEAGRAVEVIIADDRMNFASPHINFQTFIDLGGVVRISRYPKLMHHKFCLIDNRVLLTGSYNWTQNAEFNNLENVVVTTELALIKQFEQAFESLKAVTEKVSAVTLIPLHDYTTEEERQREFEVVISVDIVRTNSTDPITPELIPVSAQTTSPDLSDEITELFNKAEQLYLQGKHEPALRATELILQQRTDVAEVYELIALIKWRQGKFKEQVEYATKAVELNNLFYDAYNTLGIGYSHLSNAQKSISSYKICLDHSPDNYTVLYNRAVSFIDLEKVPAIPSNLKRQFKQKADDDLRKAIALTDIYERQHEDDFMLYYVRGISKILLSKYIPAKPDLLKALEVYNATPKERQDVHILREIKQGLKDIAKVVNTV